MTLQLVKPWDPILLKPTEPVQESEITDLLPVFDEMHQIMLMHDGVGISAPQVGISKSFFIIGAPDSSAHMVFVNPEVINESTEYSVYTEGCLSFPKMELDIVRPHQIEAAWWDHTFTRTQGQLTETISRIFLHELDHLQGICMPSRVSKLKAELAVKRMIKQMMKEIINE